MNNIGIYPGGIEIGAATDRAENGTQRFRTGELRVVEFKSSDGKIFLLDPLISERPHFYWHHLRELARKIIDVHARSAVDVWRIFVGEKESLHDAFFNGTCVEAHADSANIEASASAFSTASKVQ